MLVLFDFTMLWFNTGFVHGKFLKFSIGLGIIFGIIAGLMVFLISYNEMIKHYPSGIFPRKLALQSAVIAFLFFLVLGFIISLFVQGRPPSP